MKQNIFYLLTLLTGATCLLSACQDLEDQRDYNVPTIGYGSATPNAEDIDRALLRYDVGNSYNYSDAFYYLISENPDMGDARKYDATLGEEARQVYQNGRNVTRINYYYYVNLYNLNAGTTYYYTLHETRPHGDISSSVGHFTTYKYRPQQPRVTTAGDSYTGPAGFFFVYADSDKGESSAYANSSTHLYTPSFSLGDDATMYVYKPYNGSSTSHKNVIVNYNAGYFSYGKAVVNPETVTAVTCQMENILPYSVQLEVTTKATTGVTSSHRITSLSLANAPDSKKTLIATQGTCDLSAAPVTIKALENTSATWSMKFGGMYLNSQKPETATCTSMIPVTFGSDDLLQLRVSWNSGSKLEVVSPTFAPAKLGADKWENGKSYTYPVTITYTNESVEITIGDVTVTPWQNGGNDTIDVFDK